MDNSDQNSEVSKTRCGFVAVLGAPNAGKSTLTNLLTGSKVSIVTHKVQTTRTRIRGIAMAGDSQMILVDTPGIFSPRENNRLDNAMVKAAWGGARDADILVCLVDVLSGLTKDVLSIIKSLKNYKTPRILVLNKIDKVPREELLELVKSVTDIVDFDEVFMISALKGHGTDDLKAWMAKAVPPSPWYYPENDVTDMPMRHTAAELTREKIYLRLHQELPYAITVETSDWKKRKDGSVRIEQTIFVERASQKKIVLGKQGKTIKQISMEARQDIARAVGRKVHLFLFVKVRENWADDPERYREMGLDFPT